MDSVKYKIAKHMPFVKYLQNNDELLTLFILRYLLRASATSCNSVASCASQEYF